MHLKGRSFPGEVWVGLLGCGCGSPALPGWALPERWDMLITFFKGLLSSEVFVPEVTMASSRGVLRMEIKTRKGPF